MSCSSRQSGCCECGFGLNRSLTSSSDVVDRFDVRYLYTNASIVVPKRYGTARTLVDTARVSLFTKPTLVTIWTHTNTATATRSRCAIV